jgi:hypothetical protein
MHAWSSLARCSHHRGLLDAAAAAVTAPKVARQETMLHSPFASLPTYNYDSRASTTPSSHIS